MQASSADDRGPTSGVSGNDLDTVHEFGRLEVEALQTGHLSLDTTCAGFGEVRFGSYENPVFWLWVGAHACNSSVTRATDHSCFVFLMLAQTASRRRSE